VSNAILCIILIKIFANSVRIIVLPAILHHALAAFLDIGLMEKFAASALGIACNVKMERLVQFANLDIFIGIGHLVTAHAINASIIAKYAQIIALAQHVCQHSITIQQTNLAMIVSCYLTARIALLKINA